VPTGTVSIGGAVAGHGLAICWGGRRGARGEKREVIDPDAFDGGNMQGQEKKKGQKKEEKERGASERGVKKIYNT
jgi:hypothetical protein